MKEREYERISAPFRKEPRKKVLIIINKVLTGIGFISYPLLLIFTLMFKSDQLIKVIVIPGIGFLLLSELRKKINRKRPYEALNINPIIKKDTQGNSMPSRHVFSMAIIALSWFVISPVVGSVLFVSAVLMGIIRVIGGVHYMSDIFVALVSALLWGLLLVLK